MDRKQLIGLFIIGVMVLSTVGLLAVDYAIAPVTKLKYNDIKFKLVNNQYFATIKGVERVFVFFPQDLEFIQLSDEVKDLLNAPVVTVTYDPQSGIAENLAESQYYFEVQLSDEKVIERALIDSTNTNLPQKSCADAKELQPVVELRQGEASGIKAEGSCIIISGVDAFDIYQETERVVYYLLGVMP